VQRVRPDAGTPHRVGVVGVAVEVLAPGTQTTVQDLPGRLGLWGVGVPPSGAWDDLGNFVVEMESVSGESRASGASSQLLSS